MKRTILCTTAMLCLLVVLSCAGATAVHAQSGNLSIYSDELDNGWQDYSWATHSLTNTSPVHSGRYSVSVNYAAYTGLYFDISAMSLTPYTALTFWVDGGSAGGQQFTIDAQDSAGDSFPSVPISKYLPNGVPAGQWAQVTVPLSDLGVSGSQTFTGFWLQDSTGGNQPVVYFDDFALVAVAPPSTVHVTANAATVVQTVDSRMFGVNVATWDGDFGSSTMKADLQAASIKTYRFPGGSEADGYDWTKQSYGGQPMTADFAALLAAEAGQGYMTTNYGSGSPQMAAAWVAYCDAATTSTVLIGSDSAGRNWQTAGYWAGIRAASPISPDDGLNVLRVAHAAPYNIKYWEIGNECYGSWEEDNHSPAQDPVVYAQTFAASSTLMKKVDSAISVGVVLTADEDSYGDQQETVTNPVTGVQHKGWSAVLLSAIAGLSVKPNFVIYHNYAQEPGSESDQTLLAYSSTWTQYATGIRTMLNDYLGKSGPAVEIDCTENNSVSYNPGKQTTSLVNGLFTADSIGSALQTEFKTLLWWDAHNGVQTNENNSSGLYGWRQYGDYGILATQASQPGATQDTPYPTYFAYQLLGHFAIGGDTIVKATSDYSGVSAYACHEKAGSLTFLLINKNPTTSLSTNLAISGFSPQSKASWIQYGETQDTAQSKGATAALASGSLTFTGQQSTVTLPPYSMTVIKVAPVAGASANVPSEASKVKEDLKPVQTASYSIGCGGAALPDYSADKDFIGGTAVWDKAARIDTRNVSGPARQVVYQHSRSGSFSYTLPGFTPGSVQAVRLQFCDTRTGTPGARVFTVKADGQILLNNFDIAAAAGGIDRAAEVTVDARADAAGVINLKWIKVRGEPMVSGIQAGVV